MFTWIIHNKAKILNITEWRFTVENTLNRKLKIWESIAHDWACMTIEKFDSKKYSFFVMQESFKKTNFSEKQVWWTFNIEESLGLGDKMWGHFVTGHVDNVWKVKKIEKVNDGSILIHISFDKEFSKLLIDKWSVTINWVSLTVVETTDYNFYVSLIPLTQEITNLWDLKVWDSVNLEFDMLGKYVQKLIPNR